MKEPSERVVVTGRGAVTPAGIGCDPLHAVLGSGRSPLRRLSEVLEASPDQLGEGGLFDAGDLLDGLGDPMVGADLKLPLSAALGGRNLRPLDRTSSLLVVAAQEALADSGWSEEDRAVKDVGLVLGTTFCSAHTIAAFDRRALVAGPRYASPLDFANTVINAAAGQTAIWLNLRGVNSTVAGESAATLEALGFAVDTIRRGDSDVLLVGGAEELCFETLLGLQAAGLLAERGGMVAAESAGVLVLEGRSSALHRGARVLGEVLGYGGGFDLSLGSDPEQAAAALAGAIGGALGAAEVDPPSVDLLVAGASGVEFCDSAEVAAWQTVFGDHLQDIPVVAPKLLVGDALGAGGAVQTLTALYALSGAPLAGAVRLPASDRGLPGWRTTDRSSVRYKLALLTCVGWSGHCAAVLVGGAQELREPRSRSSESNHERA